MSSLSTAVNAVRSETSEDINNTTTVEQFDTKSNSSMDTSDVSKILKPKSIFNPYSKQHRYITKQADSLSTTTVTSGPNADQTDDSGRTTPKHLTNPTNNLVHDYTPFLPHATTDSTKQNESQSSGKQEHISSDIGEIHITELSQEEEKYLCRELARQEQEEWQEVNSKQSLKKV
jgi:hypothetical protein